MEPTRRRSFLQIALGAIGLTTVEAFGRAPDIAAQTAEATADSADRAAAIAALRVVNTLENWHNLNGDGYLPLDDLLQRDKAKSVLSEMSRPPFSRADVIATGELLDGFTTALHLNADRSTYLVILRSKSSAMSFMTDASGVIQEGEMATPPGPFDGAPDALVEAFRGAPIVRPRQPAPRAHLLAIVASFFVPTLEARGPACCYDTCSGACLSPASACQGCFPAACCNLGYQSCAFCCNLFPCEDCAWAYC